MAETAREVLDVDVVFVGAGPANLAAAIHLGRLIQRHNEGAAKKLEVSLAIFEKGKEIGSHALSGAVVDPRAMVELFPDDWQQAPFEGKVEDEELWWMTASRAFKMPIPPMLDNRGKYVASLGRLLKWMETKLEGAGVDLFCEFPATEVLLEGERVIGIRTGDKGLDHHGKPKANYEPGVDVHARAVVLGEGPRGTLVKQLERQLDLGAGKNPQIYALGVKEVWELPPGRIRPGQVIHSMHWPLGFETFGGGFLYGMRDDQLIIGLVVGLDYEDPLLDPHEQFQRFKTHPRIKALLDGGKMTFYGAKAIPEGGWWSMPRLWGDGFLLCGDSGGFLNSQRLKGIHLAMKSGMLAAETIFAGLVADRLDAACFADYGRRIDESWIRRELYPVRNFHQAFDKGLLGGMVQAGLGMVTGGRGWGFADRLHTEPGHARMAKLGAGGSQRERLKPDGVLTFDKLADVYNSGTGHEENQPVHLKVADLSVCSDRCAREFGNPCQFFCPAAVYEMVDDASTPAGKRLQINASNCVHCKTCDVMDPYQIIDWVPPEGGGGPNYSKM